MRRYRLAALATLLLTAGPLTAQRPTTTEDRIPSEVAERVMAFFNDPGTLRFSGSSRIPASRRLEGDVGVLGGPITIAGRIEGSLIVVNGDVLFEEGGTITGDLMVIGGEVEGGADRSVLGDLTIYSEKLRYRRRGDEIVFGVTDGEGDPELSSNLGVGSLRFTVKAGTNYNRVEGLPVLFGPVLDTSGRNPLRLDILAVWRSYTGLTLDPDRMGYRVRAEQMLGGTREWSVGGTLHSEFDPVEAWGLTGLEASLATFLLHTDYRDYYERQGWSIFGRYDPVSTPLSLTLDYRDERHTSGLVQSPWSLTRNDQPWRPQPLVAEGTTQSLGLAVRLDTRNDPREPSQGLLLEARTRIGVGGGWSMPSYIDPFIDPPLPGTDVDPAAIVAPEPVDSDFALGFLDMRSYNRVGQATTLNFRGLLGGSLKGSALPSQLQLAVGGEGSTPGFPLFYGDCGARELEVQRPIGGDGEFVPAYLGYGCDRIALAQIELRSGFFVSLDVGGDEDGDRWRWMPVMDLSPGWAVFMNAGRGWANTNRLPGGVQPRINTDTLFDVGLGVYLGSFGVYWAAPLSGGRHGSNFFVRLSHRF
jgi:hypothetical protein